MISIAVELMHRDVASIVVVFMNSVGLWIGLQGELSSLRGSFLKIREHSSKK